MKPSFEAPRSTFEEASMVGFRRSENSFSWNWHYHPEIELTYIEKGSGTRLVGDHSETYRPHDLVLLGANLPHTWFSSAASRPGQQALVIQFRAQMFPETLLALPEFVAIEKLLARAARGIRFPTAIARRMSGRMKALLSQKGLPQWLALAAILSDLAASPGTILAAADYRHHRSYKLGSRLDRVITYLEEHCREELSLAQMAKMAGLTPSAFSRFFRKMTGQTFVACRNSCRIREACALLAETDLSITEIAYECGFGNLANFNRRFRQIKDMVPRDYRRLHNPLTVAP